MRRYLLAILTVMVINPVWADTSYEPLLNQVTLQLNAEQWVTTKTALVTVGINVSVSENNLGKVQSDILGKLSQLSNKGEWHITAFNRSQDQSGLEKVEGAAQVRLADTELAGLRDKAKAMSKPGQTFTLDDVQFVPSEDEMRAANITLRSNIYQQVKDELGQINKLYPDQKYFVHNINFLNIMPMAAPANTMMMRSKMADSAGAQSSLAVGDKLRLSATVVLAAAPSPDVTKLVHS